MTQTSLPQAGSGVGDSGPYTSDDWAKFYEIVFTGDQAATQGVLRNYLNELEVTVAGNTISINTGAGFCYGHWLLNDTSVDITALPCAGVETGWNRIVLVQNETAVAYNTNLILPAAYAAGVPRNSCRIAILRGTCGSPGVLPALLTGPNIYMVEIGRYQVTGGAAGSVTDYRDYCEFSTLLNADSIENRTRQFFVPALIGMQSSTDVILSAYGHAAMPAVVAEDGDDTNVYGRTLIPSDYISNLTIKTVVVPHWTSGGGNVYSNLYVYVGGCSDNIDSLEFSSGYAAEAVSRYKYNCITEAVTPFTHSANDFLFLRYKREGTIGLDTLGVELSVTGFLVTYTADS